MPSSQAGQAVKLSGKITNTDVGSGIVALATDACGEFALALDDGRLLIGACADRCQVGQIQAHDGVSLALTAGPDGGFVSGGDDGRAVLAHLDQTLIELLPAGRNWVEAVAVSRKGRLIALGVGKELKVFDNVGRALGTAAPAPSVITGIAFNPKGKQIAVSHYGGVSLWWVGGLSGTPKGFQWQGSHLLVTWSPDGRFVMTSTQEKELHGWRVDDGEDIRMSGYAIKVKSMGWSADGRWLACSGGPVGTAWDFQGKGPMGHPPFEFGQALEKIVTQVATHPKLPICAIAFEDGQVQMACLGVDDDIVLRNAGGTPVGLAWSADGGTLLLALEEGQLVLIDLEDFRTLSKAKRR